MQDDNATLFSNRLDAVLSQSYDEIGMDDALMAMKHLSMDQAAIILRAALRRRSDALQAQRQEEEN